MIYITQGDSNSIGLEIFFKSLLLLGKKNIQSLKLVASEKEIVKNLKALKLKFKLGKDFLEILDSLKINVSVLKDSENTAFDSLKLAIDQMTDKDILFTLPMSKNNFYENNGNTYRGHTDYFRKSFPKCIPLMFFVRENEKICLLTDHIPLKEVSEKIDNSFFQQKVSQILHLATKNPILDVNQILIAGLNPHAGEAGILGREELNFEDEIESIQEKFPNIRLSWPLPADTIHNEVKSLKNTLVVYSYHDQGLPAFKSRNQLLGINLTLGLPFIRLSVDHGTAPSLYLKGIANPMGCVYALRQAIKYERLMNE